LLSNQSVYISNNLQGISKDQMVLLVKSAGGTIVKSEKDKNKATLCIIDQEKDKKIIETFKKAKNPP